MKPADSLSHLGETWPTSMPKEQGMDSAKLVEMVDHREDERSKNENILIDAIKVVCNGIVVADPYLNRTVPRDAKRMIH